MAGCTPNHKFRPLTSFQLNDTALSDGDPIEIVYCSGGPEQNHQQFYYHLIAERTRDKRRVNLLTDDISGLNQSASRKKFLSSTSDIYKLLHNEAYMTAHPGASLHDVPPVKPLEKVVVGRHYPEEEQNDYPVVIGSLGEDTATIPPDVKRAMDQSKQAQ